jgi:hypothetical protein
MKNITVVTTHGEYEFIGQHMAGMEREMTTWQYYQTPDGTQYQFRKEHMVCVITAELDDDNVQ